MVYFAVVDIGTTSVRCFIYNRDFEIISTSIRDVEVIIPQYGFVEIDPEKLFNDFLEVISEAVAKSQLEYKDVVLGISCLRGTFTTWSKSTGQVFHNFITWKDNRGDDYVKEWNSSLSLKALNVGSGLLYSVTRSSRFLAGSVLKLMNSQITPRLFWVLDNNRRLNEAIKQRDALFGTVDSYLLYRLRQGKLRKEVEHISEITNCAVTALFDPFQLQWSSLASSLFKFKLHMFPKVVGNSYDFGEVHESYLGSPIKIAGVMGDQSASMFGSCCFSRGDAKITLGTGTFLDINTSNKCHASILGLYPLVSWQIRDHIVNYCMEGLSSDTATIINWGKSIGLFSDPSETSDMAMSVEERQNVFFIPAFSGLSAPINDAKAGSGFIGVTVETTKNHLVKALLEAIVFRTAQLLQTSVKETDYEIKSLRIDGGVSRNDFICQSLSDLCQLVVERSNDTESTSLGIAYLCAFNMKIKTIDELKKSYKIGKVFKPRKDRHEELKVTMERWEQAVQRFKGWYA